RIMYAVVAVKFRESHLRKRLLDTGNHRMIENVASGDSFWGIFWETGKEHTRFDYHAVEGVY
ncbi:MAG: hypothetical protein M3H12_06145, partial [Chromatiales bacterium]